MADTELLDRFAENPKEMEKHELCFHGALFMFDLYNNNREAFDAVSPEARGRAFSAAMVEVTRLHQSLSVMLEDE